LKGSHGPSSGVRHEADSQDWILSALARSTLRLHLAVNYVESDS
jgi:hypothetical protein